MRLSIVIVTRNRCAALCSTLTRLAENPHLPHEACEILVVDNASTDGTADMLAADWPTVHVVRRRKNEGVSARNHAIRRATGQYILLVDDDSYPVGDAVHQSMVHMDLHHRVAAVVGKVMLPNGQLEASALPGVMINNAVCLRRSALEQVGLLPTEFFRQAEEYDLSFRLWDAGMRVERFENLLYRHEKVAGNRLPSWVHRMDMRNNLILLERYLPADLRRAYRGDWSKRYRLLAKHAGRLGAARLGYMQGRCWAFHESLRGRRVLSEPAIESVFQFEHHRDRIGAWAGHHNIRRLALADFSKNTFAAYHACEMLDQPIACVIDSHPAYRGAFYRGLPIISDDHMLPDSVDGIVLTNVNPAQVGKRLEQLRRSFHIPVLALWRPMQLTNSSGLPTANFALAA